MTRSSLLVLAAVLGCSAPKPREPMGKLPTAVTSAEPLWIPFRVHAGRAVEPDPREKHFAELRRLTFSGAAGVPVWDPSGAKIHFAEQVECRAIETLDLASGESARAKLDAPIAGLAIAGSTLVSRCKQAAADITSCWAPAGLVGGTLTMVQDLFACDLAAVNDGATKPLAAGPGVYGLTSSSDGKRIAFASKRDGDTEIYIATRDGSSVERVTKLAGHDVAPRFAPDGSQLVWHARRDTKEGGELHVWIASANGARPRQVTRDGKNNSQATFFSDSRQVVFASDRESASHPPTFALYRVDPDGPVTSSGGPRVERISFSTGMEGSPVFSPDGRWLAFLSSRGGSGMDLYVARWRE
jgi:Tol biopolymer transport system component